MSKTQFGGGGISPSVAAHLSKRAPQKPSQPAEKAAQRQFGGGGISPSVARHLGKR